MSVRFEFMDLFFGDLAGIGVQQMINISLGNVVGIANQNILSFKYNQ